MDYGKIYSWGGCFHYEQYFDYRNFPFYKHCPNDCFGQFYHAYIVNVYYIVEVDNMLYIVSHNNNWWQLMLPENANCALDYFN